MKLSDFIPLPELARLTGVNYHTLRRRLFADRQIMIDRVGRSLLIRKDQKVMKMIRSGRHAR